MTLVALDLNATRIRALCGSPADIRSLPLDGQEVELPLALSLEGRQPALGRAGTALCRRSPHLACTAFLPYLGERREWAGPRIRLDAGRALSLVLEHVAGQCPRHNAVAVAVPGYLFGEQLTQIVKLGEKAKLKIQGTVDAALAATLAAHARQTWFGLALVGDVDDHALTWSAVNIEGSSARVLSNQTQPQLSLAAWKERLLAAVSDAFIRKSRRDPRDSAEAEQSLYDQLDGVLQACAEGDQAEVAVRSPQWYQNLVLGPADLAQATTALRDRALASFTTLCTAAASHGTPRVVVLTATASRLPGLLISLEHFLSDLAYTDEDQPSEDFGAGLLDEESIPPHVQVLGAEDVARATLELGERLDRGVLHPGHLEAVPLLDGQPPDTGQPRLHFRGQDHLLKQDRFSLGRDPRCNLAFDTTEFPSVSGYHCEIVADHRGGFVLLDHSRHGTLVNNRRVIQERPLQPGDWIRLGPGGPLLRFLGGFQDRRQLMTTA
jgi:FHA domain